MQIKQNKCKHNGEEKIEKMPDVPDSKLNKTNAELIQPLAHIDMDKEGRIN